MLLAVGNWVMMHLGHLKSTPETEGFDALRNFRFFRALKNFQRASLLTVVPSPESVALRDRQQLDYITRWYTLKRESMVTWPTWNRWLSMLLQWRSPGAHGSILASTVRQVRIKITPHYTHHTAAVATEIEQGFSFNHIPDLRVARINL